MIMYPNYNEMAKTEKELMEKLYRLHHKPLMTIDTLEEILDIEESIRYITNNENNPSFKLVVLVDNAPGEVFYSIKTLFRNCLSTFNLYLTSNFKNLDNRLIYINKRIGERYLKQLDVNNSEVFMPIWELELPKKDELVSRGNESSGFIIDDGLLKRYYIYNKADGTDRVVINNSLVFHHTTEKK